MPTPTSQLAFDFAPIAKRWHRQRQLWVPPDRPLFDPTRYAVEPLPRDQALEFVCTHHYSGSFPAARLSVGLFALSRTGAPTLCGVIVFGVPMSQHVIPHYTQLDPHHGIELSRMVLAESVGYNGETWTIKRAFNILRAEKPEIRAVVSFADPLERRDSRTNQLLKRSHWGACYAAANSIYAGRSSPRTLVMAYGRVLSPRTLSKIRAQDRGADYAARQVLTLGAEPRRSGEEPAAWLDRVLAQPPFERLTHPGCNAFVFGMDKTTTAAIRTRTGSLPYPQPPRAA